MGRTIDCDCQGEDHLETCVTYCAYCGAEEPSNVAEIIPQNTAEWEERASDHDKECEWIKNGLARSLSKCEKEE